MPGKAFSAGRKVCLWPVWIIKQEHTRYRINDVRVIHFPRWRVYGIGRLDLVALCREGMCVWDGERGRVLLELFGGAFGEAANETLTGENGAGELRVLPFSPLCSVLCIAQNGALL